MSEIIVSFTSYPARIMTIDKVLDTIIVQTVLPDKIILYLSSSEFEDFGDMPNLEKYKKYGFEIHWHEENLKSHKKWFYAFQEYPEDIIITIDDDILYCNTALENLLKYHKIFPKAVIARRAHLITCNADNSIALYDDWYGGCSVYVGIPRMDLVATGNAGILYPPNIFEKETFNKDTFIEKTPYADDIWLKVMEVYSGTPVVLAERTWEDDVLLEHQIHCLYEDYNKDGGNDKQFIQLLNHSTYNKDRKKLEARIFSEGRIFCSDVNELKQQEFEKTIEELAVKIQQNNQALIYGAGVMGKRVYKLLKNKKFNQIKAFIVNNITTNPDFILDIPVKYYKEFIDSYEKIVIALLDKKESNNVYIQLIKDGVSSERIILLNTLEKEGLMKQGGGFDSQEYWEN